MIKYIYIILTSTFLLSCIPQKKTGQEYFELGQSYEDIGQFKNALKAYSKAIRKNSREPIYYVKKAEMIYLSPIVYNENKIDKKVQNTYNKSLNLQPWNEKALISRAQFYYFRFKLLYAKRDCDSTISKYPNNIDAYLLRAKIYFDKKDDENAINDLTKAIEISKRNTNILTTVGDIYQDNKNYQKAIKLFREALDKSDKVNFGRYYSLAVCYYKMNKVDSACYFYALRNNKQCFGNECRQIDTLCSRTK